MDRKLRKEIEDFIFEFPTKDGSTNQERKEKMAEEYTAFRVEALTEKQQQSFRFKLIGKSKTVLQWWQADGTDWPLLQAWLYVCLLWPHLLLRLSGISSTRS